MLQVELGKTVPFGSGWVKGVFEALADGEESILGTIEGQGSGLAPKMGVGAKIGQAINVVSVGVGIEDGVDTFHLVPKCLVSEILGGVYEDGVAAHLHQDGRSRPPVPGVRLRGLAHSLRAMSVILEHALDGRNAVGCAGS